MNYGNFVEDGSEIHGQYADQIFGAKLHGELVEIQWRQNQMRVSVAMSLRSALSLLTLLQAVQGDSQEPLPDERWIGF